MSKREYVIHAVVSPKKKKVRIMKGSKVLKSYNFKMDVPFTIEEREFEGWDYGAWSVADRGYTYKKNVKVWDEKIIEEIRTKAMDYFKNQQPPQS